MPKKKQYFAKWFEAQFGGTPMSPKKREALVDERSVLRQKLSVVENKLLQDDAFQIKWTAALYAHNAFTIYADKKTDI